MKTTKPTISKTLIKQLQPKEKAYDVRDGDLNGFIIRVNPTGSMSYVVQYTRGKRINIGKTNELTPDQARAIAVKILSDYRNMDILV